MRKRNCLIIGLVLCAAVPCFAASSADIVNPNLAVDFAALLPANLQGGAITLHQFRTGTDGLYYCVSSGPTAEGSVILKTDWEGKRLALIAPPADKPVQDFDVDQEGSVYVLLEDLPQSSLAVYGADGVLRYSTRLEGLASAVTLAGGRPVLAAQGASAIDIKLLGQQGAYVTASVPTRRSARPALGSLPDGRVMLGDRASGVIYVVDTKSQRITSFSAGGAAVGGAASQNVTAPRLGILSFVGASSSPEGDVYVIPGHYKLADGIPVLRLNSQGDILGQFQCLLPTFGALKNQDNPQGYMGPTRVGVTRDAIFLVSVTGQMARYPRH